MTDRRLSIVLVAAGCSVFPDSLPDEPSEAGAGGDSGSNGGTTSADGSGGATGPTGGTSPGQSSSIGGSGGGANDAAPDTAGDVAPDTPPVRAVLVPASSAWRFWDQGAEQAGWRDLGFDDSAWAEGNAELGYGDGDEATVVSFGPDAADKHVTTWFRATFDVADASKLVSAEVEIVRDDGALVHLNGAEVIRENLPAGPIEADTFASVVVGDADESAWHRFFVPVAAFVTGKNVLAVEIHQANATSTDISFNLTLAVEAR